MTCKLSSGKRIAGLSGPSKNFIFSIYKCIRHIPQLGYTAANEPETMNTISAKWGVEVQTKEQG